MSLERRSFLTFLGSLPFLKVLTGRAGAVAEPALGAQAEPPVRPFTETLDRLLQEWREGTGNAVEPTFQGVPLGHAVPLSAHFEVSRAFFEGWVREKYPGTIPCPGLPGALYAGLDVWVTETHSRTMAPVPGMPGSEIELSEEWSGPSHTQARLVTG